MNHHQPSFLVSLLLLLAPGYAWANNNYFLPGDAFFPTQLTAEKVRALQAAKPDDQTFDYSSFGGYDGAFCGFAGYKRARIASVDREFLANLAWAYREVRKYERKELVEIMEDGKVRLAETNGVRVLFYPQEFDLSRFKLGLQYNEKWVEECMKFGHKREHLRLCELIDDKDAVAESWRDATAVGSFETVLPKADPFLGEIIEEPVQLKGAVKAIVLSHHTLKQYFNARQTDHRTIRVVDSSGVQEFTWQDFEWKLVEREP